LVVESTNPIGGTKMATGGLGHAEVKAIEDKLEISPSASAKGSMIYSKIKPSVKSGAESASGSTGGFKDVKGGS
jgi:pyrimidine deaminase RibD-like protein